MLAGPVSNQIHRGPVNFPIEVPGKYRAVVTCDAVLKDAEGAVVHKFRAPSAEQIQKQQAMGVRETVDAAIAVITLAPGNHRLEPVDPYTSYTLHLRMIP